MKKLKELYNEWTKANSMESVYKVFDSIKDKGQLYKQEILDLFDEAISERDSKKLRFCIATCWRDGLDSDYIVRFENVILADWHEEYEDIVDLIYEFKDDRFAEAITEIAFNRTTYRKYDDENESTLRKCVHALKVMKTKKSEEMLGRLINTGNENVLYALEVYGE
jgi:hypothetical protein